MNSDNPKTGNDPYSLLKVLSSSETGNLLKIYTYPAPILKKLAREVTEFDERLGRLCKDMLHTMYQAPGIGLAAPQVGVPLRIFVMDIDYSREKVELADGSEHFKLGNFNPRILINPKFKNQAGEQLHEEGCLSVPGVYEEVKRAETVTVEFQDTSGNQHTIEAEGLLSVCLQHENDHLDGIVFIERLSMIKKNFFKKKFLKKKKVSPASI